jgi:serine/threonine protein kinase
MKPVPRKHSILQALTLRSSKPYEFLYPRENGLLGKGAFGHVFRVYHPGTRKVYAMKRLAASNIAQHGGKQFVPLLHRERDLMAAIPNHPFIVNLHGTCKDSENLYLVMDFVNGTPLGNYCDSKWNKGRNLTSKEVKYFSMCMLEALGHLHQNDIMYRDLKLENVVIDYESGLLKLIDFGLSKQLNKVKTWTVCGTPLYIAPEVISCTGYRFGADWWMFGVVVFELVYAITPFDGEDQFEIFKVPSVCFELLSFITDRYLWRFNRIHH